MAMNKNRLISIRGTNGSGKSTVVRNILDKFQKWPIYGYCGFKSPEAYGLVIPGIKPSTFILGSYERVTGGVDNIQPYDLILEVLKKYIPEGHVIFEGLIVTSVYGRVMTMLE